jgi:hypothetical protein
LTRRLIEGLREGLQIWLGLHQGRYCFLGGHRMNQSGSSGKCCARGHSQGAGHAWRPAYNDDPSSISFVVASSQSAEPVHRMPIGYECGPPNVRHRKSDVHHHDSTDLVPGEHVPSAQTPERDGQVRSGGAVHHAAEEIETGWSVDRNHRHVEVMDPLDQCSQCWTRCT